NTCRVSDPQLMPQLGQQLLEPARVAGGLDSHPHGPVQPRVKLLRLSVAMLQATFNQLARLLIQHRDLLVARMQITPYNLHVLGSFPPSLGSLSKPSLPGGTGADTV